MVIDLIVHQLLYRKLVHQLQLSYKPALLLTIHQLCRLILAHHAAEGILDKLTDVGITFMRPAAFY
jgi:hypothetical protein